MFSNSALDKSLHIFGDEKVLTVSEISNAIKKQLDDNFQSVKVQGEVSGLKKHTSGHTYLSLKDDKSVIKAVYFKGTKLSFQLEDGMEIVASGRVTTYNERSQYQIIVKEAHLAGEGALLKLLNERKKHFESLGYFEKSRKKSIPQFPKIIGIVTSQVGSVLQDMRHRLEDRYPFCFVHVWSVNVQGVDSAEQVAKAIRGFNLMVDKKPDILIVARGGGSIEDLLPFSDEIVIKAVFDSKIPIISAIGHETDYPLIDYVSDLRAPTPTAAIELATPVLREVKSRLAENSKKIQNSIIHITYTFNSKVVIFAKDLSIFFRHTIETKIQEFKNITDRLPTAIKNFFQQKRLNLPSKVTNLKEYILRKKQYYTTVSNSIWKLSHTYLDRWYIGKIESLSNINVTNLEKYISLRKQCYTTVSDNIGRLSRMYLDRYLDKIESLSNRLEQASFKKILEKGFCFITDYEGKTVETKQQFEKMAERSRLLHFQDGSVEI
jgi:exodeoxyribonuclease VII large subunit